MGKNTARVRVNARESVRDRIRANFSLNFNIPVII